MCGMSLAAVAEDFRQRHADIEILSLDESGATVDEAAQTLGIPPDAVAKTLALHRGEEVILLVTRGDTRIDNRKYRDTFHEKARMLKPEEVEPLTGHPVGGLCPFGLKGSPRIYMDESLQVHEYVYPAAGDRFHAFRIATRQLEDMTGAQWVDVCR